MNQYNWASNNITGCEWVTRWPFHNASSVGNF